jgi:hypothetical protein
MQLGFMEQWERAVAVYRRRSANIIGNLPVKVIDPTTVSWMMHRTFELTRGNNSFGSFWSAWRARLDRIFAWVMQE